ncbi:UbiA prenyltransferase [Trametopsis cervina]|nr:UbiA prenyltransferase [Trametopsis cervina]
MAQITDETKHLLKSETFVSPSQPAQPSLWWSYIVLARLHRLAGASVVVMSPCLWGLTMAAYSVDNISPSNLASLILLWVLGNILRRSAACVWNDICDRDVDRLVERSKNRPLAAGTVSLTGAYMLLAGMMVLTLFMLSLAGFHTCVFLYGCAGIALLDMPYPLTKRWTYWPQAWLGTLIAWGAPTAWISVTGDRIDTVTLGALVVGNICWTIVYDTIYACQDVRDDVAAGVKSTAVLFGRHTRVILSVFATAFVLCLAIAGISNGQGAVYFAVTVAGAAGHLVWQLATVDLEDGADCSKKFLANGQLGYLVLLGMAGDYLRKVYY